MIKLGVFAENKAVSESLARVNTLGNPIKGRSQLIAAAITGSFEDKGGSC